MALLGLMLASLLLVTAMGVGCGGQAPTETTPVKFMLDWVPNTNHTGIYVAQEKGYFREAGLEVQIVEPGEVYPEAAVAGGAADFGVSFQESVTLARAEGAAIVSVAAVLQHNTSGFAALAERGVKSPADFEGLRYGAWGSPTEVPTLKALMECAGADFGKLQFVTTGFADPLALIAEKQVDLVWIFYGWQGIQAEEQGIDLDIVMMKDYFDCIPDYYTPVIITSESTLKSKPEIVKSMLRALSRGYTFAAEHPEEAAAILLAAVPELEPNLVKKSQKWLADYYVAEASQWGEQRESVWQDYADWLLKNGVVTAPVDVKAAFSNEFLP